MPVNQLAGIIAVHLILGCLTVLASYKALEHGGSISAAATAALLGSMIAAADLYLVYHHVNTGFAVKLAAAVAAITGAALTLGVFKPEPQQHQDPSQL